MLIKLSIIFLIRSKRKTKTSSLNLSRWSSLFEYSSIVWLTILPLTLKLRKLWRPRNNSLDQLVNSLINFWKRFQILKFLKIVWTILRLEKQQIFKRTQKQVKRSQKSLEFQNLRMQMMQEHPKVKNALWF